MTTSIDIAPDLLQRVMERAKTASPQEAIAKAVEQYALTDKQRLIERFGKSETFMSLDELLEMRRGD